MRSALIYDFEVFKEDWMCVLIDVESCKVCKIVNDKQLLQKVYTAYKDAVWIGYNSNHYDQYILQGILCGFDPKPINDEIIGRGIPGQQVSPAFKDFPILSYDTGVLQDHNLIALKTLEGMMGDDIEESTVPFDIDRKLTPEEIKEVLDYCTHDVKETEKVFENTIDTFFARAGIVQNFTLPPSDIKLSDAQLISKVIDCKKRIFNDDLEYPLFDCLQMGKYQEIYTWFDEIRRKPYKSVDDFYKENKGKKFMIGGVEHIVGMGGLHGAREKYHAKGRILHVDVSNYYPSMLIGYDLVTRASRKPWIYKEIYDERKRLKGLQKEAAKRGDKAEAKKYKDAQLPYKKLLNSASGAMKAKFNEAFDPRNNNSMCINGQLMMIDLIDKLESVESFELIQSNTDGLIIKIDDDTTIYNKIREICDAWEKRVSTPKCDIKLDLDEISEIWQANVNNYLWIDSSGGTESKGSLKEITPLSADLPIVRLSVINYMTKNIPLRETIYKSDSMKDFQKIVRVTSKYNHVVHEESPQSPKNGEMLFSEETDIVNIQRYDLKSYRVYASRKETDGRLIKVKADGSTAKAAGTPDKCFIYNKNVNEVRLDENVDREWYLLQAEKLLESYGIKDGNDD